MNLKTGTLAGNLTAFWWIKVKRENLEPFVGEEKEAITLRVGSVTAGLTLK